MPGPNAKPFDDWEADVRPRSACPHFSKTHSNRFGFDLVVERLRPFSPGLLALDLAYPRPSTTRTLYPLPLAHDLFESGCGKDDVLATGGRPARSRARSPGEKVRRLSTTRIKTSHEPRAPHPGLDRRHDPHVRDGDHHGCPLAPGSFPRARRATWRGGAPGGRHVVALGPRRSIHRTAVRQDR